MSTCRPLSPPATLRTLREPEVEQRHASQAHVHTSARNITVLQRCGFDLLRPNARAHSFQQRLALLSVQKDVCMHAHMP